MTRVSVLIPTYQSERYLSECLDSIFSQSLQDFEILLLNEFGSNDRTIEIANSYNDSRLKVIQNTVHLGLAKSLNKGIQLANGEYLARIDADDLAHPTRFEKQVDFLDNNKNVGVCGTYQHHFGEKVDIIHEPPIEHEQIKSNLLFACDVCHSTLMLRRQAFLDNNLFYNDNYFAEDFELWLRAVKFMQFHTLPEVLGEYRVTEDNISVKKKELLNIESGKLVLRSLSENLNIEFPEEYSLFFQGWDNPFYRNEISFKEFQTILFEIYQKNSVLNYYREECLRKTLGMKWNAVRELTQWNELPESAPIEKLLEYNLGTDIKFSIKKILKSILKKS